MSLCSRVKQCHFYLLSGAEERIVHETFFVEMSGKHGGLRGACLGVKYITDEYTAK